MLLHRLVLPVASARASMSLARMGQLLACQEASATWFSIWRAAAIPCRSAAKLEALLQLPQPWLLTLVTTLHAGGHIVSSIGCVQ